MDNNYIQKRNNFTKRVKIVLIDSLGLNMDIENIDNDTPLFGAMGLGLDSVDALELVVGIEQEFGILLGEDVQSIFYSVNTIVDYLMSIDE